MRPCVLGQKTNSYLIVNEYRQKFTKIFESIKSAVGDFIIVGN